MRQLFECGASVHIIKSGYDPKKVYKLKYDYEDLIYIEGIPEPFQPNEIKKA